MAQPVENEEFRFLGEAICSAQDSSAIPVPSTSERTIHSEIGIFHESVTVVATPLVGPNDIDYTKCSTETLMNIVKQMGEVLSPEALCVIHQIALNRPQASPESN